MYIGSVDNVMTQSIQRREAMKRMYDDFMKKSVCRPSTSSIQMIVSTSGSSSTDIPDEDEIRVIETPLRSGKETQKRRGQLQNLASVCDRTGISDRSAVFIVNAALLDLNVINTDDSSKVIDRSKIRRERKKVSKHLQYADSNKIITVIYFDGRKDNTFVMTTTNNTAHRKTITEEHISLLSEPDSEYIGHFSIDSVKSNTIEKSTVDVLEMKFEFCSSLVAMGCDGTAVNTGPKNGVIDLLQKHLKRPLQWFVCLLHANELPFRHLFSSLEGTTTGSNSFSGSIGKRLDNCLDFKVEAFEPFPTELLGLNTDLLSSDQKYMYQMCSAISPGTVSPNLAIKDPGKLTHPRWLTCANRILRLYIGTAMENFKDLANFIIKVYAPTWFDIKTKSSCKYGPINVFNMVKRCLYLRDDLKNIVFKTVQKMLFSLIQKICC
ncbi:hypothetical protein HELRODRAFT_162916 [Helobdella robusta]|uniref:Uncharacterized protein n=1 Tax=Helobdella robusta TaxID=6412 RepID=T1ETC6_HELRO|nr:hypothetical protein HELRODRAFT_162916 [Helobdella robusta]ESN99374.1 hypothetical protein HELRODRAFT_162916 [Helobdella robusta]